jgi:hypothetical protein
MEERAGRGASFLLVSPPCSSQGEDEELDAALECPCGRTILADTSRGFRYKTSVPNADKILEFTACCQNNITGDEMDPGQIFPGRPFQAFG